MTSLMCFADEAASAAKGTAVVGSTVSRNAGSGLIAARLSKLMDCADHPL